MLRRVFTREVPMTRRNPIARVIKTLGRRVVKDKRREANRAKCRKKEFRDAN